MSSSESEAFNAIHEEAEKLLRVSDDPKEVRRLATLIISLARYRLDVRAKDEKGEKHSES